MQSQPVVKPQAKKPRTAKAKAAAKAKAKAKAKDKPPVVKAPKATVAKASAPEASDPKAEAPEASDPKAKPEVDVKIMKKRVHSKAYHSAHGIAMAAGKGAEKAREEARGSYKYP